MYPTRQSGGRFSESSLSVQRWRQERGDGFSPQTFFRDMDEESMARLLGWFSIGLGAAEVFAPGAVARLLGVRKRPRYSVFSASERITSGIGILTQRRPASWLWSRVGGDMMDLSLLALALASHRRTRGRIAAAAAAVVGVTALDLLCGERLTDSVGRDGSIRTGKSVHVNRSPEEVYKFWKNYENFPRFMYYLESVKVTGDKRSQWVAKAPAGMKVEWDAETVQDIPNERIAWRSLEGSTVPNSGEVRFERGPGGRGTIVRVAVEYRPPAGPIGAANRETLRARARAADQRGFAPLQAADRGGRDHHDRRPAGGACARSTSLKYDITSRRNAYATKNASEKNETFQKEERI
jgi:uncharacterized membrane protein